jgi:hypothetical protein
MGKTIKLTESELINIIQKIMSNRPLISEVDKTKDFDSDFPEYNYSSIGIIPSKSNPNEIGVVFFNGIVFNKSDYTEPERPRMISFNGPLGEFEFDSRDIHYNGKSPYVFGNKLNDRYYDKLFPLMTSKPLKVLKSDDIKVFESDDIKQALKMAFPNNWVRETPEFTAGLRDIHTIGDYLKKQKGYDGDTTETWSLMNFFDTRTIPKLINAKWEKEGSGNKIEWLTNIFKNDKTFLNELLNTQWKSVYSGFYETEPSAIKKLKKMFEDEKLNATFETYPMGHKKDRNSGVDVKFTIEGKSPRGVQIKPATKIQYLENGDIKVYTNSMTDNYKNKSKLDYILYDMGNTFYLFRNSDYFVVPNTNGSEVIHHKTPARVYDLKTQ